MRFGVNTFLWSAHFGPKDFHILPEVKAHGFDGIEATLIRPEEFDASAIRGALAENDLQCTICSALPGELSLISEQSSIRSKTVKHLSECIHAAAEAGAKVIAGPLYSPVGYISGRRRTEEEWKWAIDGLRQLGPALESCAVELCIEPLNRFETFFLNTTRDARALCEEIAHPRIGMLWDTFHANIEEKDLAASLLSAGRFVKHVHTCENDRGIPGTGHVSWIEVFRALKAIQYDGWLTIESFGFALGDIAAAASIWRDLADEPNQIAWDGVTFLKSLYKTVAAQP